MISIALYSQDKNKKLFRLFIGFKDIILKDNLAKTLKQKTIKFLKLYDIDLGEIVYRTKTSINRPYLNSIDKDIISTRDFKLEEDIENGELLLDVTFTANNNIANQKERLFKLFKLDYQSIYNEIQIEENIKKYEEAKSGNNSSN